MLSFTIERAWIAVVILLCVWKTHAADASPNLSALSIPPTQQWDGIDGKWSTFGIQIGNPPQQFRVLPMSQEGAIWVVLPDGCTSDDGDLCGDNRGGLLQLDQTPSWHQKGIYNLSLIEESMLGYGGAGLYGHDRVGLGWPGNNLPGLDQAVIAGVATKDFYMGGLPLNPWPVNFTTITDSTPSLMTALKNASNVPSLTYGYTAGYYGHQPPIFGSLTLGGHDTNRYISNDVEFIMGADISRDLLVAVQSIKTVSTDLLSQPLYAFIDSAIPAMWLPVDACHRFELAFNLTWNDETELYLIDEALHGKLTAENPIVSLQIGPNETGESVKIDMPYGAFDLTRLNTTYTPYPSNASRYFPLKRTDDPAKYTLGRAFLQNAYIIVNYENSTFSVHQATYPSSDIGQNLVTLERKESTSPKTNFSLTMGTIIGIAIGAGAVALIVLAFTIYVCYRRNRAGEQQTAPLSLVADDPYKKTELDALETAIHEKEGNSLHHELSGQYKNEMDASDGFLFELSSIRQSKAVELPVSEVAAIEVHSEASTPRVTPSLALGSKIVSQYSRASPNYHHHSNL